MKEQRYFELFKFCGKGFLNGGKNYIKILFHVELLERLIGRLVNMFVCG
jgi:hypothetical protein